jgi:hypothetical protein
MVHPVLEGGLVCAYIISGVDGLMVIDPGSVGAAEKSFRLLCQTTRPRVIYPGHGEIIRDVENALLSVKTDV